jgi:hypothetical protein
MLCSSLHTWAQAAGAKRLAVDSLRPESNRDPVFRKKLKPRPPSRQYYGGQDTVGNMMAWRAGS